MSLPTNYLTSTKNLPDILNALRTAQAPKKFSYSFLESLDFKSSSDRLISGVLRSVGFLDSNGVPTTRYFQFLDQGESARVLAEGIREAYADLFQLNTKANELSRQEIKNKFKTLTQGKYSDDVLGKMAATFEALVKQADFKIASRKSETGQGEAEETAAKGEAARDGTLEPMQQKPQKRPGLNIGGLVYNIAIHLPESRDSAVYDALFRSLKEHLID
ncbi:MAG: DUF5343 domain-containing protein [Terriglobales bacterium]